MKNSCVGLITNTGSVPLFSKLRHAFAAPIEIADITGGNTGNICFVQAIEKLLAYQFQQIDWTTDSAKVQQDFTQIVVCAANQLGPHSDLSYWAERLEKFSLPVTIICIGAQSSNKEEFPHLQKGTLDFLKVTQKYNSSSGANISVRGKYTQRLLANYGIASDVIGCPSLFLSEDPELGSSFSAFKAEVNKSRISITAGNPFDERSKSLEAKLVGILSDFNGDYILQHPKSFIEFCFGDRSNLSKEKVNIILDFLGLKLSSDGGNAEVFLRDHSNCFIDIGNWMQRIRRSDFVIGTRYHGVAIGIQAGIPGCVYTIDSRTEELCETTGIKSIPAEAAASLEPLELLDASRWSDLDIINFQQNRFQKSAAMAAFLESNNLNIPTYLKNLHS